MASIWDNFKDYASSGELGGAAAGIGNGLYNLFGFKNPSDSAKPYLDNAYNAWGGLSGSASGYLNPYMQAGTRSIPVLEQQFSDLLKDPTRLMDLLGSKYKASPGYQYNVDQATQAAKNLGAASGMAGSPASQQELAHSISGLASQDYNQYLQNALGQYNTGLRGYQDINHTGYNASNSMIQALIAQLQGQNDIAKSQAENAYSHDQNRNQSQGGGLGSILGGLGSLIGGLF